ncbi:MAG: polysaccharide deacetylase family protein [Clostridia bacterium]|nr:polysaccharide deacetylase family protein [Clostridia bacterium]
MSVRYRIRRLKRILIALMVIVAMLLAALGVGGYFLYSERQNFNALQQRHTALSLQKEALTKQLTDLQERSDALSAEQQLQIDALSTALAETQQAMEELDNAVAELSISLGGKIGSSPLYFTKPDCPKDAKLIALTFDDGPSAKNTPVLLDGLKERGVRATFFVVGENIKGNEDILKRIHNEGHVIGNHTLNHKNLAKESEAGVREQLVGCSDLVEQVTGQRPVVARMPGGSLNDDTRVVLAELGLPAIGWSVDTRDWESKNVDAILAETFQSGQYGVRDGAIILMHDRVDVTPEATLLIVDRLLAEGYTFVTVPELLAARKPLILTGAVYSSAFPIS